MPSFSSLAIASVALLSAGVFAECPNACSGHGDCKNKDQCACYDGFFGGDCSLRVCPLGSSFVDAPWGDLNHGSDGATVGGYSKVQQLQSDYKQYETWPSDKVKGGWASQAGESHYQVECSGKGSCNRALGVCKCFDGFTGAACQRTTCPNDCSGHGVCATVGELAAAGESNFVKSQLGVTTYAGVLAPSTYRLWDQEKNTACVCDTGYSGIDCSLRECPRGDDPLTWDDASCGGKRCASEVQSFSVDGNQAAGTYYLLFTDFDGTVFKTEEFTLSSADTLAATNAKNVEVVKSALESLPNDVTGSVIVSVKGGGDAAKKQLRVSVTFSKKSGNLPPMKLGWEGTSNPGKHMYIFQPSTYVQTYTVENPATFTTGSVTVLAQLEPTDSSLAPVLRESEGGEYVYWATPAAITIASAPSTTTAWESVLGKAAEDALNAVPVVKFAYYSYFQADSNVIVVCKSDPLATPADTCVVTVALPDHTVGELPLKVKTSLSSSWLSFSPLEDSVDGNYEAVTCSNRGLCDFSSGLCKCFAGHTGVDCAVQSALSRGDGAPKKSQG